MKALDELREYADNFCGIIGETLTILTEDIEAELAKRYVALPLDADGEPIHVGDVMEFSEFEIEHPVTRTVEGIGQGTFFAWCGERGYQQHDSKRYRHHRPPTVEDVLREFALRAIRESEGNYGDLDETCAEYAKRLRLAGDAE